MHGTPAASHASETGLTVSGVEVVSIRSIWSELIRSFATCAAALRVGLAVLVDDGHGVLLPPIFRPPFKASRAMPEHEAVRLAEAGGGTGPRADEADLQRGATPTPAPIAAVGTGSEQRRPEGQARSHQPRGAEEVTPAHSSAEQTCGAWLVHVGPRRSLRRWMGDGKLGIMGVTVNTSF